MCGSERAAMPDASPFSSSAAILYRSYPSSGLPRLPPFSFVKSVRWSDQMKRIARSLLFAAAALFATTDPAVGKDPRVRYGIPKLGRGQVWISSLPVGLEVKIGKSPNGKSVGRTPLVLRASEVGSQVTIVLQESEFGEKLPIQFDFVDYTCVVTHSTTITYPSGERAGAGPTDVSRGLTYRVDAAKKPIVIALFQPRSAWLSDWAHHYPPGSNFRFSENAVRRELAARGVRDEYVRLGVELLHRGGKVALPGSKGWLIAEVTADRQVLVHDPPQ
jgi:hypothetical protein